MPNANVRTFADSLSGRKVNVDAIVADHTHVFLPGYCTLEVLEATYQAKGHSCSNWSDMRQRIRGHCLGTTGTTGTTTERLGTTTTHYLATTEGAAEGGRHAEEAEEGSGPAGATFHWRTTKRTKSWTTKRTKS